MLENPLFLRTNAILTAAWAGVYLFEGAANFLLASTFLADYSALLLLPVMLSMLLFTHWFQRWYPARVARGR